MRGKYIGIRINQGLYTKLPKKGKSDFIRNVLQMYYNNELIENTKFISIKQEYAVLQSKNKLQKERLTELNNDKTRLQADIDRYLLEISKRDKEIDYLKNRYLPKPKEHFWQFWKKQ